MALTGPLGAGGKSALIAMEISDRLTQLGYEVCGQAARVEQRYVGWESPGGCPAAASRAFPH